MDRPDSKSKQPGPRPAELADLDTRDFVGELMHRVGHEIGNPLTAIISLAAVLEQLEPAQSDERFSQRLRDYARSMSGEAWKISVLSDRLVQLFSTRDAVTTDISLRELFSKAARRVRQRSATLAEAVDIEFEVPDPAPHVNVDPEQTINLLFELLLNAAEEASAKVGDPGNVVIRAVQHSDSVSVTVENEITQHLPAIDRALFAPLVSHFPNGKHLGLGLAVCRIIAERCQLALSLGEERRNGKRYFIATIEMPLSRIAQRGESLDSTPHGRGSKGARDGITIVIIDDDDAVTEALQKLLEQLLGTRSAIRFAVARGTDVFAQLESLERVDLILCDMELDGTSGRHVFETLRNSRPELLSRIIFSSGDLSRHEVRSYIESTGRPALTKPFERAELEQIVQTVLNSTEND